MVIWIAGGTTEGRMLASFLSNKDVAVYVTVATAYGTTLVTQASNIHIQYGRLDAAQMIDFIKKIGCDLVIDATHPYAIEVTANLQAACKQTGRPYRRILRKDSLDDDYITVHSMVECADLLSHTKGTIFLTTGSKELHIFTTIPNYADRFVVRILPVQDSLTRALTMGYKPANIVCMQGPFSRDLNEAMFRHFHAAYVVTKDSGSVGGFQTKIEAARACGATPVVIARPEENGESLAQLFEELERSLP